MRTRFIALYVAVFGLLGAVAAADVEPPAPPPFFDALAKHGTWSTEVGYGWYWQPVEAQTNPDWRPYLQDGYWRWAEDAWSWSSETVWGATVFHYGRWAYIEDRGWVWIPGEEYAPAWVHWVKLEGYWAWAPLPPEPGFAPGFSLSLHLLPEDFVMVPEGVLTMRPLENVAVVGLGGGASAPPAVAVAPPATVVAPAPVVVSPQPSTVIIRESVPVYHSGFSAGLGWSYWNDPLWYRASGYPYRRYHAPPPPVRRPRTTNKRRPSPPPARVVPAPRAPARSHPSPPVRIVPNRSPAPAPTPPRAPKSIRAAPLPTAPRSAPRAPATSGSRRAQGVRGALNRR